MAFIQRFSQEVLLKWFNDDNRVLSEDCPGFTQCKSNCDNNGENLPMVMNRIVISMVIIIPILALVEIAKMIVVATIELLVNVIVIMKPLRFIIAVTVIALTKIMMLMVTKREE